ncbi:MAG: electron transfer flavoprotein subunit beta/FixA family protein [Deltaproteobacteria bacterium]|nr:electron transfer flavoprotein subunit beta/FixA family protein [Deltaproteobacteria bacterium]
MKIVVCVKQVPEITEVKVDPQTGVLIREGVPSILNPFCEYALDHALRLKEAAGEVTITALTMGPPQAEAVLLRALELGADRAVLISDRKFAGADTWATALTLAAAVRLSEPDFDLILVGKQAIDGDTAQVGPEMAEILGLPQVMYGVEVEATAKGRRIRVKREMEAGYQVVEARLPALVSASKGEIIRRLPSMAQVLAARGKPIQQVSAADLDLDDDQLGLEGSFTQVVKVFPPAGKQGGRLINEPDPVRAAARAADWLQEKDFI